MNRWPAGNTLRALQHDLPIAQRSISVSREFSSSTEFQRDEDDSRTPRAPSRPTQPKTDTLMGIGTRKDQRQAIPKPATTDDTTYTPIKITRQYRDYAAPGSTTSSTRGSGGTRPFDARAFGASRPQGQRIELSPAIKARLEANRRSRGAAAAGAGRLLRSGGSAQGRGDSRMRRRRDDSNMVDEDPNRAAEIAAQVEAHVAPPPRQWLDHTPENLTLEDLRVDWPTIPTGKVGMVTGVEEKLRWMARRMKQGYETPRALANRLEQGKLVHFESEAEKTEVMRVAGFGNPLKPHMTGAVLEGIGEEDRAVLTADLIKGVYPPVDAVQREGKGEKKQTPLFMNEVLRVLDNNETYHMKEKSQLYGTIEKLLSGRKQQQQQDRA